jgi:hypothetical protein
MMTGVEIWGLEDGWKEKKESSGVILQNNNRDAKYGACV